MFKKKYIVIAVGIVSVLLGSLFVSNVLLAQSSGEYDPWLDYNDDGIIDINDLYSLGQAYGSSGEPINKTKILLELQARAPKEGNISVSAAAFVPENSTVKTYFSWMALYNYMENDIVCFAQLQLPHNAKITNMTCYWYDNGTDDRLAISLYRYNETSIDYIAGSESPIEGAPGDGVSYADYYDPNYAIVDNNRYAYSLFLWIPYSSNHLDYSYKYTLIEYEYPEL